MSQRFKVNLLRWDHTFPLMGFLITSRNRHVPQDKILETKPQTDATNPADMNSKSFLQRMWGSQPTVADPSNPKDFSRPTVALGKDLQAEIVPQLDNLASKSPDITIQVQEFREAISQAVAMRPFTPVVDAVSNVATVSTWAFRGITYMLG